MSPSSAPILFLVMPYVYSWENLFALFGIILLSQSICLISIASSRRNYFQNTWVRWNIFGCEPLPPRHRGLHVQAFFHTIDLSRDGGGPGWRLRGLFAARSVASKHGNPTGGGLTASPYQGRPSAPAGNRARMLFGVLAEL